MIDRRIHQLFILFAILVIGIIILVQLLWFKEAKHMIVQETDKKIIQSLRMVNERLLRFNRIETPTTNAIQKVDAQSFWVNTNAPIYKDVLQLFLTQELDKIDVHSNFEFYIYDCASNQLQCEGQVCVDENCGNLDCIPPALNKSQLPEASYYFVLKFQDAYPYTFRSFRFWIISSLSLLLISGLFTISVFMYLRQKKMWQIQVDFTNNISHGFKTPLTSIELAAKVLQNDEIIHQPTRLKNYAHIVEQESKDLKKQINEVLRATLIDQHKSKIELRKQHLIPLIKHLLQSFAPIFDEKQLRVETSFTEEKDEVFLNEFHISHALSNLLDNAIKYGNTDNPLIRLSVQTDAKNLQIVIADNGSGIPKDELKHIFEKYYRMPAHEHLSGYGLGLHYVKNVIHAHNGDIQIESKIDLGTKVIISLPLA